MVSRLSRPNRTEWLVALVCGGWVAAFDARNGWAFALIAAAIVPFLLVLRRHPVVAAAGTLAAMASHWMLAGSLESPGILAPALASAFALGRYASVTATVLWIAVDAVLLVAAEDIASAAFAAFLLGGPALFGVLVRRRTASARTAEQLRAEAAARDPAAVAVEVVTAERARLARDTVGLVRDAVASMLSAAATARSGPGHESLAQIQALGRSAVTDLRRLLGLLRHDEPRPASPPPKRRAPWRADVIAAVCLCALAAAESATSDPPSSVTGSVLAILGTAAVSLRRTDISITCLAFAVVTTASIGLQAPTVGGFWSAIVALLLSWTVGASMSARAWAALGLLVVARVAEVRLHAPGNVPLEIAFFLVGFGAGYLWAERERVERAALAEVDRLSTNTSSVVEAAVREERLRVARELHDVTSHAVGVMVVQAGAAAALADSDPVASGAAVAEVERAGTEALVELDLLGSLLAQDGPRGEAPTHGALGDELLALVRRMSAGGLRISHDFADLHADDPALGRTTYRVVQEALTNALRHAPRSEVSVRATTDDTGIQIQVTNDASGDRVSGVTAPAVPPERGFGLIGLAERVRSLGGTLSTGPSGDGGFAVLARLPL